MHYTRETKLGRAFFVGRYINPLIMKVIKTNRLNVNYSNFNLKYRRSKKPPTTCEIEFGNVVVTPASHFECD